MHTCYLVISYCESYLQSTVIGSTTGRFHWRWILVGPLKTVPLTLQRPYLLENRCLSNLASGFPSRGTRWMQNRVNLLDANFFCRFIQRHLKPLQQKLRRGEIRVSKISCGELPLQLIFDFAVKKCWKQTKILVFGNFTIIQLSIGKNQQHLVKISLFLIGSGFRVSPRRHN